MDNVFPNPDPGQRSTVVQEIAWERLMKDLISPNYGRFKIYGGGSAETCGSEDERILHSAASAIKQKINECPDLFSYSIYVAREEQKNQEASLCIFAEKTELGPRLCIWT